MNAPGAEGNQPMNTDEQLARPRGSDSHLVTEADMSDAGSELKAACKALRSELQALERSLKVWLVAAAIVQGVFNPLIMHAIWSGS